jgi:hypothetical protein
MIKTDEVSEQGWTLYIFRLKVRHPLPSRVPKPVACLAAAFMDGATLSQSLRHCDHL